MATASDTRIVSVLDTAVAGINPVLDVLAERDPLGLKGHTFHDSDHDDSRVQKALHLLADAVNVTDWPGTQGWSERSINSRADWWVTRIGTFSTVAVAYPGIFGAWAKRLPISSTLGFASQAMVLVAVAREYGVTDRARQVELLAAILCGRNVGDKAEAAVPSPEFPAEPEKRKKSVFRAVWDTARDLKGLNDEMSRRPQSPWLFRMLAYIPLVGAPAIYLGERIALSRAAKSARKWIADHPDAIAHETSRSTT